MTDTMEKLLAAIRENPGDKVLRGAYADWLKEHGQILDGLLQNIIAEPGEDRWRLDYAAELERTAGAVACELCKGKGYYSVRERGEYGPNHYQSDCLACRGSGRVSDGRKEFGEFIRVQVRIHYLKSAEGGKHANHSEASKNCHLCYEVEQGVRREHELWGYLPSRNGVRSLFESTLPGAAFCTATDGGKHLGRGFPIIIVQRGLPSIVRCTPAEWMGERCERCQGRGHRTLYGDGSGPWTKCQYCVDGRTPGIGPRLAQRWPIVAVEVTNREPSDGSVTRWNGFAGGYGWFRVEVFPGNPNEREDLPKEVFDRLTGGQIIDKDTNWRVYDSEHAARAALSDAMLAWARGQAFRARH